jgi:pilus assembly protein Flp/PilA
MLFLSPADQPAHDVNGTTIGPIKVWEDPMQSRLRAVATKLKNLWQNIDGTQTLEYILLTSLIGIGTIAAMATVRDALINELGDLAAAINAINS